MRPGVIFYAAVMIQALACAAVAREDSSARLVPLQTRLREFVEDSRFAGASWGIKIVHAKTGEVWFEHHPQALLSPASNSKLYTVALALDRLGAVFRVRTTLSAGGETGPDGVLKGDLLLQGRGDPCIKPATGQTNLFGVLQPFIAAVTNAGIRRVTGDLIADESFFRGSRYGSGWVWQDFFSYYGAEVSALTINDNTVEAVITPGKAAGDPAALEVFPATGCLRLVGEVRTGASNSVPRVWFDRELLQNEVKVSGSLPQGGSRIRRDLPVVNPAALFGAWLKQALERSGVTVEGEVRVVSWPATAPSRAWRELGFLESLPVSDLAREVQKPSQNLYTDLLLAQVGERSRTTNTPENATSEELGIAELNRFLRRIGIAEEDVHFEEGSGLSRNNLTTARATVALLQYMSRQPTAEVYWAALPLAGVDGTLRNRFKGTKLAGNLEAKTGTLRWAAALSGRLRTAAGEPVLFSFMLNRYAPSGNRTARAEIDALTLILAEATGAAPSN